MAQHDAQEFWVALRRVLGRLPGQTETSPAWAAWRAEPEMHTTPYTKCRGCSRAPHNLPEPGMPPREPESLLMATLDPAGEYLGVADVLRRSLGPAPVPDRRCPDCGHIGAMQSTKCRTLPDVLVVQLKRFRQVGHGEQRIGARIPVEPQIDFAEHLAALAGPDGGTRLQIPKGTRYRARAVVCHTGATLAGGHYTCWVRAAPGLATGESDTWVCYDDSYVGRPEPALPPHVATDAYLLFYELRPDDAPLLGPERRPPVEARAADRAGNPAGPGPQDEPPGPMIISLLEDDAADPGAAAEESETTGSDTAQPPPPPFGRPAARAPQAAGDKLRRETVEDSDVEMADAEEPGAEMDQDS